VKESKNGITGEGGSSPVRWQPTSRNGIVRHVKSGSYYARIYVAGKEVWRSLKTDKLTIAEQRFRDHKAAGAKTRSARQRVVEGSFTVGDALRELAARGFRRFEPRNRRDLKPLKPAALAYYQQRLKALERDAVGLLALQAGKVTTEDIRAHWADSAVTTMSGTAFNHTRGMLVNALDLTIAKGVRTDNPAQRVIRTEEGEKKLTLPSGAQFDVFLKVIDSGGSRDSRNCGDLVRFLAYSGCRRGEAAWVRWSDCDFLAGRITLRGDPKTGLKNRQPGETRTVPMIPEMRAMLERLRAERPEEPADAFVMQVRECQKSMDRAARVVRMSRIVHHDLRHLFATKCIEAGIDIPTVAGFLGHADGGALAMRTYGHLRDEHAQRMAAKVRFATTEPDKAVTMPKVGAP